VPRRRAGTWLIITGVLGLAMVAAIAVRQMQARTSPIEKAAADPPAPVVDPANRPTLHIFRNPAPAPALSGQSLDGRAVSIAALRGKVTLINFWATWCGPCRAEIPTLIALQDKYRETLQIVGVSEDEVPPDQVRQFATTHGMNYPVVMETPEMDNAFPGVSALPTSFLVDRDGRIATKHVGQLDPLTIELETRALAGLAVDADIDRSSDTDQDKVAHAAQTNKIPGVDLSTVPPDKRAEVLQELNTTLCSCGCRNTVAMCRVNDPTCDVSLPMAKKIVEKYKK
jgi:thiol-disulfide isomerase/thioredoxin